MLSLSPIGTVKTSFKEKFGVPRQSGMISEARGILKLNPDPQFRDAVRCLETFSHVWIVFQFHRHANEPWRPLTTPPRVDAPGRVGVFASRSPHRPNQIGLSAVKLERIDLEAKGGIEIHLSGVDFLDDTPVFDIKPYVPYVDSIPDAHGGWTETEIPKFEVEFSAEALLALQDLEASKLLITQMLELDPRPTPQKKSFPISDPSFNQMTFAFRIQNLDVKWEIRNGSIFIREIVKL
jgi:tRNA-Thr(GGU) m(6)t(6)A37 methyltransferase TsaA